MRSLVEIEEIPRGKERGSAEGKGLTEREKLEIELKEVREAWKQVLLSIERDKIRHARKLAEIRAETRAESRDAAELERRRCKPLERKIAEVEELIEAEEDCEALLLWLRGASPSVQKSAVGEYSTIW